MGKMGASRPIEPEIALYNDSLERCSEHHDFLERFYEVFAAAGCKSTLPNRSSACKQRFAVQSASHSGDSTISLA